MRVQSRTYYISATNPNVTYAVNMENHKALAKDLDKLGGSMVDAIGQYQGKSVLSWLICSTDPTVEKDVVLLANKYGQESILVVHGDNQDTELVFSNGSRKMLGTMVSLGRDEGKLKGRDYAYVNDNYYVVEGKV